MTIGEDTAKKAYSFRLLKDHILDPSDALKEAHRLQEKPLADGPANKRLFAGQAYGSAPSWISFFDPADQAQFDGLYGGQAAAVLFIRVQLPAIGEHPEEARWLALCFGMAFQEIRPEAMESQFGLKVALNQLGQDRIKSIDTRRPEDATIQTRSQNSRTGAIFDFGIETSHIILQAITGKSEDQAFGGTLTGSDALKLSCEIDYHEVEVKAAQIAASYRDNTFEELFPWYGKITPIRDRSRTDALNDALIARLRAGELNGIHLAPPEIVDYQGIDRFKFSGMGRLEDGSDELSLADYLALFDDEHQLTLVRLRSDKVRTASEDAPFIDRWPVFKCICAEFEINDVLYILAADEWYSIKADFVGQVNEAIDSIPHANLDLPPYRKGEKEGAYNQRAIVGRDDLFLYDKDLVAFEGERGRIEFCDLLSANRQLVHVKRRNKSQTLSHLFMQGQVSAEAFLDYPGLRDQIRVAMPAIQDLVPAGRPNPPDYEVVYALLHEGNATLPFFSKVALATINRQLRRMNYNVALLWVGPEADL